MISLINKIKQNNILVIGDMMLDLYLSGKASRISPEAPVPVVSAEREDRIPGGAANVIVNLCELGCRVTSVGFVGHDSEGDFLVTELSKLGVNTEFLMQCSLSTIHKTRVLANGQHVVRFDFDSDFSKLDKEQNSLVDMVSILGMSRRYDAVIISDYCKGTITPAMMEMVKKTFSCPIICDTKPKNKDMFSNTFCITPNIIEARQMLGLSANGKTPLELAHSLKKELQLNSIIITMAEDGILCLDEEDNVITYPAYVEADHDPHHRFDVTGAGDTVISVFTAYVAAGYPMQESVLAANIAAGVVVKKVGTASCSFEELLEEFRKDNDGSTSQIQQGS